jgi:methionyl-tRNA formyltransferase
LLQGTTESMPQDETQATMTRQLTRNDGKIDWTADSASRIERMVRAYAPWPGVFTTWNSIHLTIIATGVAHGTPSEPGVVASADKSVCVGTVDGGLILKTVQLAGGSACSIQDFINGHRDFIGAHLGT